VASRTKARLATNPADQELHRHLAEARRSLDHALDTCTRVARSRNPQEASKVGRARQIREALRRLLAEVGSIGYLEGALPDDVDLLPEPLLALRFREKRAAERKRRREQLSQEVSVQHLLETVRRASE